MLYYDNIDVGKGIDIAKTINNKECTMFTNEVLIMGSDFKILYGMVVIT